MQPLKYYSKLINSRNLRIATIAMIVFMGSSYLVIAVITMLTEDINDNGFFLISMVFYSIFVTLITRYTFKKSGMKQIEYFYAEGNFKKFLFRFFIYLSYGLLIAGVFYVLITFGEYLHAYLINGVLVLIGFSLIGGYGYLVLWYVFVFLGLMTILYWLALVMLTIIIKFAYHITLRIARYNKGAIAGVTLLITMILGVLELYLKLGH
jgi:hypothetical protein